MLILTRMATPVIYSMLYNVKRIGCSTSIIKPNTNKKQKRINKDKLDTFNLLNCISYLNDIKADPLRANLRICWLNLKRRYVSELVE